MRRLLITGGAGFIGANFTRFWLARHGADRVVVLDALTYAGSLSSLAGVLDDPRLRFVHGDIRDVDLVARLLAEERISTIVHFAAESHVDRSIFGPDPFLETNVMGTHALLKTAASAWAAGASRDECATRFHHVSTDEVYGSLGPDDEAFTEQTPYAPNSPYAASKAASDHLVRAYRHTYGLPTTTSNCSNNYGPYHLPEKLVPLTIVNMLLGRPVPVYGTGLNVRDWLFVHDHCLGIEAILERGAAGETYNVSGNCEQTNLALIRRVGEAVDGLFAREAALRRQYPDAPAASGEPSTSLITMVPDRPGHDWRYAVNATKIANALGFRPTQSLDAGIQRTVSWYVTRRDWWEPLLARSTLPAGDHPRVPAAGVPTSPPTDRPDTKRVASRDSSVSSFRPEPVES